MVEAREAGPTAIPEQEGDAHVPGPNWYGRMSDNIAYALLVYTALQIFMTMGQLQGQSESLLPYLALVVLVAAIIPACRQLEARWERLADEHNDDVALASAFRRDRLALWLLAIGLPFGLTGIFGLLAMVFSH